MNKSMKRMVQFVVLAITLLSSQVFAQREPINGWENFGTLDATFFARAFASESAIIKSIPDSVGKTPKNFAAKYKKAFYANLRKTLSEPVYVKTIAKLNQIKKAEGLDNKLNDVPEWQISGYWSWYQRDYDIGILNDHPAGEPIPLWYHQFNPKTQEYESMKIESTFPYDLGKRFSELVLDEEWERKTYWVPQVAGLQSILPEKDYEAMIAFAFKHCGVSFFCDECILHLLDVNAAQRKRLTILSVKIKRKLRERQEEWNEAIQQYNESEQKTQDFIKLKKIQKKNRGFQFEMESDLFAILDETQMEQVKKWRKHPVELKRYVKKFDAWINFEPRRLFELPEPPSK